MTRQIFAAAIIALSAGLPAHAEQFAVRINDSFVGASAGLLETLKIIELETFTVNGAHYVVLEAPSDAYVEAYVLAIHQTAVELNSLDADWLNPVVAGLPLDQRLGFLRPVACNYCTG